MLRRNTIHAGDVLIESLPAAADLRGLHRCNRQRYPFLLESTAINPTLGQFDILFAGSDDRIVLHPGGKLEGGSGSRFLAALDSAWRRERVERVETSLPFVGGWFLYLGYELAGEIEPALTLRPFSGLPTAFAVRCHAAVLRDARSGESWVVCEPGAERTAVGIREDLAALESETGRRPSPSRAKLHIDESNPDAFLEAVVAAQKYIIEGDIYQANLSREWTVRFDAPLGALEVYSWLARANPAPFAGSVAWRDTSIISSSPERLLSIRNGNASTRPIAGTRPRSDDRSRDRALSGELFADPKERAEHIMLIDLERNDLGRICRPGTVTVDEMMTLESYAHVHHIVSNVIGKLRADVTPGEAIAAVFPGGTITGCPKVRCMQIIAELEDRPRGAYTGSFGYLNRDGSLDLNILIRTMVHTGDAITFSAGAGIVADSSPGRELAETRAKAEGMLRAIAR